MKCNFVKAMAIAASMGLAADVSAQYQNQSQNARYSSYGSSYGQYRQEVAEPQDPAPTTSPSDVVQQPATESTPTPPQPPVAAIQQNSQDCAGNVNSLYNSQPGGNYFAPQGGCDTGSGNGGCGASYAGYDSGFGSRVGLGGGSSRNITVGARALFFDRKYEDHRLYGNDAIGDICSTDTRFSALNGFETFLGVRNCNGLGFEAGYWGLYPTQADVSYLNGPFNTAMTGLSSITLQGSLVDATLNTADSWRSYRNNEFHNLEFNFLRNGSAGACGGPNIEWLAGVRYFHFDEGIRLAANNSTAPYPPLTRLDFETNNRLIGFQLGGRSERCLVGGLSLVLGCKFGVFNNEARLRSSVNDGNGNFGVVNNGVYTGQAFAHDETENNVATLGELDLGLNWQFAESWRANIGYRIIGVGGVALAPEQVPYDWTNFPAHRDIDTNSSLFLHGAYVGLEHAF